MPNRKGNTSNSQNVLVKSEFLKYDQIKKPEHTIKDEPIDFAKVITAIMFRRFPTSVPIIILEDGSKIYNAYMAIIGNYYNILLLDGSLLVVDKIAEIRLPTEEEEGERALKIDAETEKNWFKVHHFSSTIEDLVEAIISKKEIEGISLFEKILDPHFRFVIPSDVDRSIQLSCAFADIARESRARGLAEGTKMGTLAAATKRMSDADEFAKNLYSIIQETDSKEVSTVRGTVEWLNKKGINSPNGGKWYKSSLQLVQKRWKELGLISDDQKKSKKLKPE